jgi:YD repeat-containing protein
VFLVAYVWAPVTLGPQGNRTLLIDPDSVRTRYTYDELNRLETPTFRDGQAVTYEYFPRRSEEESHESEQHRLDVRVRPCRPDDRYLTWARRASAEAGAEREERRSR